MGVGILVAVMVVVVIVLLRKVGMVAEARETERCKRNDAVSFYN